MSKKDGTGIMDLGPEFNEMVAQLKAKYPAPAGGLGILSTPKESFLEELERRMKERAAEADAKTRTARKKR
jgi:hypothetical protein